ncbi:hypothetical protein BSKO_01372 [Bryopsis sp. KO-2023]|nr:hypothetical protein BSKO_01372 [Bryopsis sp. KO-2023]
MLVGPNPARIVVKASPSMVWGEHKEHSHLSLKNWINGILCVVAAAPSVALVRWAFSSCGKGAGSQDDWFSTACLVATLDPIVSVNLLYFLNVSVGFWVVGLLQKSFWLIDPYWTFIAVLITYFYRHHPSSLVSNAENGDDSLVRSFVGLLLVWVWLVRLTHSYFRREGWKFGEREDWRYTKLAKENPRSWYWKSFFAVGLAQQPMIVGVTLPLYSMNFVRAPWGLVDTVSTCGCLVGLITAFFADNQLYQYMQRNQELEAAGKPKEKLLRFGLWRYSRHPNYFGEQLFWWSFGMFSVRLGHWWALAGTLINSIVLGFVTVMTEERMLKGWDSDRVRLYEKYKKTTSVCIPLPSSWDKEE